MNQNFDINLNSYVQFKHLIALKHNQNSLKPCRYINVQINNKKILYVLVQCLITFTKLNKDCSSHCQHTLVD